MSFFWGIFLLLASTAAAADEASVARSILAESGVQGGLIVHVGCGDGQLTAALSGGEGFVVQGLDSRPANVERARLAIREKGLYGPVAADAWEGPALPYADNLVNLLVISDTASRIDDGEIQRVLTPRGVAVRLDARGEIRKPAFRKSWPEGMDEWTHYLYSAANNAVGHDALVGPPRHVQWVGDPMWSRHHDHTASMPALVSSGGRIFYIVDEGPKESVLLPPQWSLAARDAFNGVLLWKRPIDRWSPQFWPLKSGPNQLPRRLVADGDRVFATLGINAAVSLLDAATGKARREFPQTKFAEEMVLSQNVLLVQCAKEPTTLTKYYPKATDIWDNCLPSEGHWDQKTRRLYAIVPDSGRTLWEADCSIAPLTLAADSRRIYFFDGRSVHALDRSHGNRLWQSEAVPAAKQLAPGYGPTLVVAGDVVLLSAEQKSMHGFDAASGRKLWTSPHSPGGHFSPDDLLVVGGLAWCGLGEMFGRDLHTGQTMQHFKCDIESYWFHNRCHRSKATDRYILASRTGIEFIDLAAKHWTPNNWVRGGCLYGIMPANGLVYAPPHSCGCYLESKLTGFNALAAESPTRKLPREISDQGRLERGPAYQDHGTTASSPASDDWPLYRHDAARSGWSPAGVASDLRPAWSTPLRGRLSSPVVAGGRVLVAAIDAHTLHALSAGSGKPLWSYTAGGRVDSPPALVGGRVFFGCADGWIYALRAADGVLAWRFRAAPLDRRVMSYGQLESAWPVSGSVLPCGDAICAVAGRSAFLDGGLRLVRLHAASGRKLSETVIDYGDPEASRTLHAALKGCTDMPVAMPDVLSSDGERIYLRSQAFDPQGVLQSTVPRKANDQLGPDAHLFARTGFLDGSWFSRSYWIYGRGIVGLHAYPAGFEQWCEPAWFAPSARIMVFGGATVYGFGRRPEFQCNAAVYQYRLFAADRAMEAQAYDEAKQKVKEQKGFHSDWKLRQDLPKTQLSVVTPRWAVDRPPFRARALALAGNVLLAAGPPDVLDEPGVLFHLNDPAVQARLARQAAALEGRSGALLWAVSANDGTKRAQHELPASPVWDGMAVAGGRVFLSLADDSVVCFAGPNQIAEGTMPSGSFPCGK
jgi:outer membrane protein assembly factor BamB